MKRKILLLFLLNFIIFNVFCQKQINIGKSCSYYGEKMPTQAYTFSSDNEAEAALKLITDASGLSPNFTIVAGNVPNACATMIYNAKTKELERYIVYNQTFMYNISQKINYWASISILAHEVGHHLNGHSLQLGGSRPSLELEADKFSGFILAKLGATLDDAQSAINSLVSEQGSATHPPKSARLAAIANGWYKNGQELSNEQNIFKTNKLATRPALLFFGDKDFREQVFIKKTSTSNFDLISEKGYLFPKIEYQVININENLKIFWFPDWTSYGYVDEFMNIPFNKLVQCKPGNAPFPRPGKEWETIPGNYLVLLNPQKQFVIYSNGKPVIEKPQFIFTDNDGDQNTTRFRYDVYKFYTGTTYLNIRIYTHDFEEAVLKNKIIVTMGFLY